METLQGWGGFAALVGVATTLLGLVVFVGLLQPEGIGADDPDPALTPCVGVVHVFGAPTGMPAALARHGCSLPAVISSLEEKGTCHGCRHLSIVASASLVHQELLEGTPGVVPRHRRSAWAVAGDG